MVSASSLRRTHFLSEATQLRIVDASSSTCRKKAYATKEPADRRSLYRPGPSNLATPETV